MAKAATKRNAVTEAQETPKVARNDKFKIVRTLQLPVIQLALNKPVYLKILDKMVESTAKNAKKNDEGKDMDAATIVHATDMESGENVTFICAAVVKGVWVDGYPNDSYVGKCFEIVKGPKPPGRRYHSFTVNEVADPTA